jgi:hypothetical protein
MPFYDDPSGNTRYDASPPIYYDGFEPPIERKHKMSEIQLDLSRMTLLELYLCGHTLHTHFSGNPDAPAPVPTAAAFLTALTDAEAANTAYEAEKEVLAQKKTLRDTKADVVRGYIGDWRDYGQSVTHGDAAKLQGLGFTLRRAAAPVGPMPKVQGLKLSISDYPGDTDWMCDPVKGVSVYILQINRVNPDTESEWKYADSSTKSSGTLTGNTPGKIWVRVGAKGADAQPGPWSDPAEDLVR